MPNEGSSSVPHCCKCDEPGYYYCPSCLTALHAKIDKDLDEIDNKHKLYMEKEHTM